MGVAQASIGPFIWEGISLSDAIVMPRTCSVRALHSLHPIFGQVHGDCAELSRFEVGRGLPRASAASQESGPASPAALLRSLRWSCWDTWDCLAAPAEAFGHQPGGQGINHVSQWCKPC